MSTDTRTYRYGDFPELFWDLQKDAEIDRENPSVIARVLRSGNPKSLRELVSAEALIRHFDELVLPEHVRAFWSIVVEKLRGGERADPPLGRP
jgi:hypothetical protein